LVSINLPYSFSYSPSYFLSYFPFWRRGGAGTASFGEGEPLALVPISISISISTMKRISPKIKKKKSGGNRVHSGH
jgi:hypothetical protein